MALLHFSSGVKTLDCISWGWNIGFCFLFALMDDSSILSGNC